MIEPRTCAGCGVDITCTKRPDAFCCGISRCYMRIRNAPAVAARKVARTNTIDGIAASVEALGWHATIFCHSTLGIRLHVDVPGLREPIVIDDDEDIAFLLADIQQVAA